MSTRSSRAATTAAILLLLAAATLPAQAVIIDSGDGTGNTSAPADDPGWANVGQNAGFSGVYLGDGWILTAQHANHVNARFAGLHTKAVVVDRETVYVGSLNLDPRSIQLNTEMGMIVSSTGLAEEVAAIAERDMGPSNSWRVRLDQDGKLYWESTEGIVKRQPAQSSWQRIQMWFFGIAPEDQL